MSECIGRFIRSQVIGLTALFIALSGVAYAATSLPKNSVKSKQIKNGQVKTKDVKDNGLTGVDIDEATLNLPASGSGGAASDLNCSGCVATSDLADAAVTIPKLAFDPATQAELNSHNHDNRYFTETELQTDDASPPNVGSNFVHWNVLNGVPAGFADGVDDTGGTANDLNCSGCVDSGDLANAYWELDGNAGTTPATHFLGTTDNQPLNLRVDNARAFRLEPASDGTNQSPNVIGGSADNTVPPGVFGATLSGGGRLDPAVFLTANRVTDHQGTVGGGGGNRAGDAGGGPATAIQATVGGGAGNDARAAQATVGGGQFNVATGTQATVGGGQLNVASGTQATVGGGFSNDATGGQATVGGGSANTANAGGATVDGGSTNTASGARATVGGGNTNTASGAEATIGGGISNDAIGLRTTIAGGDSNSAGGERATVGGGVSNTSDGAAATVPGGLGNNASGDGSFVAGTNASNGNFSHDGVFLFSDSSEGGFASAVANEFAAKASGGFRFRTSADVSTGCNLPAGSGTFSCTSDRKTKTGFDSVSPSEVLAQLARLPIESWIYKTDPAGVRHIGPTAQAFKRTFGIGEDPRTISTVDADGVALAAIKGLNERVDALSANSGTAPAATETGGSGSSLSPAAVAGIAALCALLAGALGAAVALRCSARAGGRLATG